MISITHGNCKNVSFDRFYMKALQIMIKYGYDKVMVPQSSQID